MKAEESKLLKRYEVTTYLSGIVTIAFYCIQKEASIFRNANDLFTITVTRDSQEQRELVSIPELETIGARNYYTSYRSDKEEVVITCIPDSYFDEEEIVTHWEETFPSSDLLTNQ